MSKVSVFDHGWIDLVFEGRNQEYGAYQLRKQDSKTTILAFFTGVGIMALLVSIPMIINYLRPQDIIPDVPSDPEGLVIVEIEQPVLELPKPKPTVEQPAGAAAQSNVSTTEFKPLAPTTDPVTTTITTQQLITSPPAGATTEGTGTGPSIGPVGPASSGTGPSPAATTSTGSGPIEIVVDVTPEYPGGLDAFRRDVANRFKTPDIENLSVIKVLVSFVVEPDGTLSNIKATRDPGYGLGTEAVRVLKSLKTKWKPGMKGGKAVRTAYSLPITVKIN